MGISHPRSEVHDEAWKPLRESVSIKDGDEGIFEASRSFINFTKQNLSEIQEHFNILDDLEVLCPWQFQTADRSTHDCIAIHKHLVDIEFRVPFHHFFYEVLSSLTQLLSNLFQMGGPTWLDPSCYGVWRVQIGSFCQVYFYLFIIPYISIYLLFCTDKK